MGTTLEGQIPPNFGIEKESAGTPADSPQQAVISPVPSRTDIDPELKILSARARTPYTHDREADDLTIGHAGQKDGLLKVAVGRKHDRDAPHIVLLDDIKKIKEQSGGSVALEEFDITPKDFNAIIRYYIDMEFIGPLKYDMPETLLFQTSRPHKDEFRIAGFLVTNNKSEIIIADTRPAKGLPPDAFRAVLFPIKTKLYNKIETDDETKIIPLAPDGVITPSTNLDVSAFAEQGRSVTMNNRGVVLFDNNDPDPCDIESAKSVLRHYCDGEDDPEDTHRPYFIYRRFVIGVVH